MSLTHPLARVLGKGSAKSGVHHWWVQRVTAIALVPLTLWMVVALLSLRGVDHAGVIAWMHYYMDGDTSYWNEIASPTNKTINNWVDLSSNNGNSTTSSSSSTSSSSTSSSSSSTGGCNASSSSGGCN